MKGLRCVACQICEKECPPQCIYIVKDTDKKPDYIGKLQFQPKVFDIDISVCMSCQICVEVCPFEAIKMDTEFELSNTDRFGGLLLDKHAPGQVEHVTTTKFIPPRLAKWMRVSPPKRQKPKPRQKRTPKQRPKPPRRAQTRGDSPTRASEMIGDFFPLPCRPRCPEARFGKAVPVPAAG